MPPRSTVLLVCQLSASFISQDLNHLRKQFDVIPYNYRGRAHPGFRLVLWMVRHRKEYDFVLIWFGDVHATVATTVAFLLRKPSVIVVGGYDASDTPGHGFLSTAKGRMLATIHFRACTQIWAVSEALIRQLGVFRPKLQKKSIHVPVGFDTGFWIPSDNGPRGSILSVALAGDWHRAQVKGLDRVVECARRMPERSFEIVGVEPSVVPLFGSLPTNLRLLGPMAAEELRAHYQAASVYLQLSRDEGFGGAVAEAMASGCIPVVSRVGGLPDLVRDVGFDVDPDDPESVADAIGTAMQHPELRERCRASIMERFSSERREQALAGGIRTLLARRFSRGQEGI